jgi:hypothetical protein
VKRWSHGKNIDQKISCRYGSCHGH